MQFRPLVAVALGLCLLAVMPALAQQPQTKRVRGSIESIDGAVMTVKTREGPTVPIRLADNVIVMAVSKLDISAIQPNSFVGVASLKQPDGTMKAIEVLVFPESARGSGEGHYPWDLQPESMMTNATVGTISNAGAGRVLELTYKDGKQTISVPDGAPIVTFAPGDRALLAKGTHVFVGGAAVQPDGSLTAARVLAGKDGLIPPM